MPYIEQEQLSRAALIAILNVSVLEMEYEEEDDTDEEMSDEEEDDTDEEMSDEEEDMEEDEYGEEYNAEEEKEYAYESALANLSFIGVSAYDSMQRLKQMDVDSLMYEQRLTEIEYAAKQYKITVFPYVASLTQDVLTLVGTVDEESVQMLEHVSLLSNLDYGGYNYDSSVRRVLFTKQLIDAYVLTR